MFKLGIVKYTLCSTTGRDGVLYFLSWRPKILFLGGSRRVLEPRKGHLSPGYPD
jgi:hypothetical protein